MKAVKINQQSEFTPFLGQKKKKVLETEGCCFSVANLTPGQYFAFLLSDGFLP